MLIALATGGAGSRGGLLLDRLLSAGFDNINIGLESTPTFHRRPARMGDSDHIKVGRDSSRAAGRQTRQMRDVVPRRRGRPPHVPANPCHSISRDSAKWAS